MIAELSSTVPNFENFENVINLQLKKPKNWNWKLSTSKSSPHIALPTIKLYNHKGQLVLQTADTGQCQRKSWHSLAQDQANDFPVSVAGKYTEGYAAHLQRCKSDSFYRNNAKVPQNKQESIKENAEENLEKNRSFKGDRVGSRKQPDGALKSETSNGICEGPITNKAVPSPSGSSLASRKSLHNLRKSQSDVLGSKESSEGGSKSLLDRVPRHSRSRSDDAFKRKLKYNDEERTPINFVPESLDNSIPARKSKRKSNVEKKEVMSDSSTEDIQDDRMSRGHRRSNSDDVFRRKPKFNNLRKSPSSLISEYLFNSTLFKENKKNTDLSNKHFTMPDGSILKDVDPVFLNGKPRKYKQQIENISNKNEDFIVQGPRRYKTKTCNAGTLIISGESFQSSERRRKRRPNSFEAELENREQNLENFKESSFNRKKNKHVRQCSDPTEFERSFDHGYNSYRRSLRNQNERTFPIYENLPRPQTANEQRSQSKSSAPIKEDVWVPSVAAPRRKPQRKHARRKVRRRRSHEADDGGSTSSGAPEERKQSRRRKESGSKACVAKEGQRKGIVDGDESDLLKLVRQLTPSGRHVIMGANVSRHSSKGLSGRRSQSSGSICNGKGGGGGRHADGKLCGSLPSYLEDRNSNGGCNNNHDCERPPSLDEVPRIPPLGDGAPLHWKFSDTQTVLCDQGYGSERSPEEEYPPPLPEHDSQCHHHLEPHACYPFIVPECTFGVKLTKGSRGLGLSVTGGIDSGGSWPGLIRIKRLFPLQPASQCGLINVGDLLLEVNGITLTGLTNYEALEVLRTAPNQVELKVCRPPPDVLSCVSPISEIPPPPPKREPPSSLNLPSAAYSSPEDDYYHGEFEVTLKKIQGSLGFTLRKEDDSALGHYVRALVREPALTDGRIKAGDKIIAVNETEISPMSHEQAVQFLRQCGDIVKLRLYRDSAQTPVAALSPTETTPRASFCRKANLRQEAVDMLNDIAVRKLIPNNNQDDSSQSLSPNSSPRKLRRQTCPSDASYDPNTSNNYYINDEQFHEGLLHYPHTFEEDPYHSLFIVDPDDSDRPSRPSSLDLYNPNQTPVVARKPRFNFSLAHNAYELNNLDSEVLDAPNLAYNLGSEDVKPNDIIITEHSGQEPASMPYIPLNNPEFSHKNPAYQTAHPQCVVGNDQKPSTSAKAAAQKSDDTNMKKWKGVVFEGNDEGQNETVRIMAMQEKNQVLAIELNRGWNSRLGFSLQGAAGVTYVSAVHPDSVAAKDGRLKPGDRVIKVNDESVEHLSTNEIIDLLRIVRGPVCIVVLRNYSNEDCVAN